MRIDNWPERMLEILAHHAAVPFSWGVSDCMQLVMESDEAITGVHPFPDARGGYKSRAGAARCLKAHGFSSIVEALAARYKLIPVSMAQRGDNGVVMYEGVMSSVVCDGGGWVGKTEAGTLRVPRPLAVQAFRVT